MTKGRVSIKVVVGTLRVFEYCGRTLILVRAASRWGESTGRWVIPRQWQRLLVLVSKSTHNTLHVAVDPSLYTHYSAGEAYPDKQYPFPTNIDEVPDFTACNDNNNHAAAKITHVIAQKT